MVRDLKQSNPLRQTLGQTKYHIGEFVDRSVKSGLYFKLDRLFANRQTNLAGSTVVIAGFWRSGTTWMQQSINSLLDANSIFEPFAPRVDTYVSDIVPTFWPDSNSFRAYHMPFCDANLALETPRLRNYLSQCLTAQVPGAWVRTLRDRPDRSFRPVMTVKFVRAQLCLHAIYSEFRCPIVYITRDPRAAIASCLRNQWGHFFQQPFLKQALLDCTDNRRPFFQQYEDEIGRYDSDDAVSRIAFFWAVLERFVRSRLADYGGNICWLTYEDVLATDCVALGSFLEQHGFQLTNVHAPSLLTTDSKMTQTERQGVNRKKRQSSWKDELSSSDINRIEAIVCRFGLDEYLAD
ncbi:MAG: sulfotransferase domain-containing protein [Synechococcus sp.]